MSTLYIREACVHPECPCAQFCNASLAFTPLQSNEQCASCNHPWYSHSSIAIALFDAAVRAICADKGGCPLTICGGFHPFNPGIPVVSQAGTPQPLTTSTPCICSAPWAQHVRLHSPSSTSTTFSGNSPNLYVPPAATHTPSPFLPHISPSNIPVSSIVTAAPIRAFSGLPLPPAANVAAQRRASAARTLPQHQTVRGGRSVPGRGRSTTVIPRHPFPGVPSSVDAAHNPDTLVISIALYPFTFKDSFQHDAHPTPSLHICQDQVPGILRSFERHNLFFDLTLDLGGGDPLWKQINDRVIQTANGHGLTLPVVPSGDDFGGLETAQVVFMNRSRIDTRDGSFTLRPIYQLAAHSVTESWIRSTGSTIVHPWEKRPLLWLYSGASSRSHAVPSGSGEVHLPPGSHATYARTHLGRHPRSPSPIDLTSRPSTRQRIDIVGSHVSPVLQLLPQFPALTSQSESEQDNSFLPMSRSSTQLIDMPEIDTVPDGRHTTSPISRAADVNLNFSEPQIATAQEVQEWLDLLADSARHMEYAGPLLFISGSTEESVAQCIVDRLVYLYQFQDIPLSDRPLFQVPPGVSLCAGDDVKAFLVGYVRNYHIDNAVGEGVERAALLRACSLMCLDFEFFGSRGPYYIPQFIDVDLPSRHFKWKAFGTILAITIIHVRSAPLPISLFLIMALLSDDSTLTIHKDILAHFDRSSAVTLYPWLMLQPTDEMPVALNHPISQLLMSEMDIQWTTALLTRVLLGRSSSSLWNNPEFKALQEGFNIFFNENLSVNSVKDFEQLRGRIVCIGARDATCLSKCYGRLFFLRLLRYLQGVGHPEHPELYASGLVSAEDWSTAQNDRVLRSKLLLMAVQDSAMIPLSPDWRIMISVLRRTDDRQQLRPLFIHACTYDVDVEMSHSLEDLLLYQPHSEAEPTHFDAWIHSQLLTLSGFFNRI
ncbi:hypothetical protein B0H21DRAFT_833402 [Amylocystis lapponica]|nr:hypothetical protein B0H21DRAFT_833402 [Amylocystis lapponica]